jgi:hypothetical protein
MSQRIVTDALGWLSVLPFVAVMKMTSPERTGKAHAVCDVLVMANPFR